MGQGESKIAFRHALVSLRAAEDAALRSQAVAALLRAAEGLATEDCFALLPPRDIREWADVQGDAARMTLLDDVRRAPCARNGDG